MLLHHGFYVFTLFDVFIILCPLHNLICSVRTLLIYLFNVWCMFMVIEVILFHLDIIIYAIKYLLQVVVSMIDGVLIYFDEIIIDIYFKIVIYLYCTDKYKILLNPVYNWPVYNWPE